MTTDAIIDGILQREGLTYTDNPSDAGGPTKGGITLSTLAAWRGHAVTAADVEQLGADEIAQIYDCEYVRPFEWIADARLQVAAVDFGVNSGVVTALKALQRVLDVVDDGHVGAVTKAALAAQQGRARHLTNELLVERIKVEEDDIARRAGDRQFEHGWLVRVVGLYVAPETAQQGG